MNRLLLAALTATSVFLSGAGRASDAVIHLEALHEPHGMDTATDLVIEAPSLWFVELSGKPVAEGRSPAAARSEHQAFRSRAQNAGLRFTERYAYETLFNGFSISMSAADLSRLSLIEGVRAIYPVETIAIPEVQPASSPAMATALAMTGADIAHNVLGLDGSGIRVAVMDTGIDIDHPDFGGSGVPGTTPFPTARIVAGYDFVGDAFNANPNHPGYNPVPEPNDVPDDCNGHGTHVAGIVGADGEVTGVAPKVSLGAYRVFGCEGSTTADIMLLAMERALADDMDVLNMSIGAAFQWPEYPTARAASRLVDRGMVVIASIGNSGATGLYSAGAPGVGEKVIGVASFDNSHVQLNMFTVSPDDAPVGYAPAAASPAAPTSGTLPMARTGTASSTADACAPLAAGSLAGQAALIRRGTCSFHEKAFNAQSAGAAAVVLYNNAAGRFSPTVAGTNPIVVPVVAISDTEGVMIDSRLAGGAVEMTWTDQSDAFLNPTGGLISSFSSYGMAPDLSLKPDIGAPGGLIHSTYPLEDGGYATISGTSMSAPHVAGAAALYLQAAPQANPRHMRTILQNSASPKNWWGNPGLGFLDNVHRQGAGMLRIDEAVVATTRVEPSKLSLGESQAGPSVRTLSIRNQGNAPVTYALSHEPALSTGPNTFVPAFITGFASVAFSAASVEVPVGGVAQIDVTITANPGLADGSQYGGYLVVSSDAGQVRVPYAGFKGDYQAIVAMPPVVLGFANPMLRPSLTLGPNAPITINPDNGEVAWIVLHLSHQSRLMRVEARSASNGRNWGRVLNLEYLGRNAEAGGFSAYGWDGTATRGNSHNVVQVPNGDYVLELTLLKALGDPSNPDHWETWTSPVVTIAR